MLNRGRSRNTPNYASQQQAGSSVDGGRQQDPVTDQVPPREPTIQAPTTESPVSEVPALDTPTPMDPLTPEPKGQPTRSKTDESFNPTSEPTPPQPELVPTHYETAGVSEGIYAGVWPIYNKVSKEFDEKRLKQWNDDLDVLLIFVSLLVRVATVGFIITCRPHYSLRLSRPSSSGLSMIWIRTINNSRPCSSTSS